MIGVPKEVKTHEYRVGMTPAGVVELTRSGHTVLVENEAGEGSGVGDREDREAGAEVIGREMVFARGELIVKVKEPLPAEYGLLREGQTLFTYLHLAPNRELTEFLLAKRITALGYETLAKDGALPLLAPMSEIAGRMAPLMGAFYCQRIHGGTGMLPRGATGVRPARALILGAGVVGTNAALVANGLGMDTVVLNPGVDRLRRVDELFAGRVKTVVLSGQALREELRSADVVVGAVLVPGERTPLLINRAMLATMKRGAVLVDVSVDQGGCAETTVPATHDKPVYTVDGVIHYTVANMPGAYPRTSTLALTNATLPYIRAIAEKGVDGAIARDPALARAVNVRNGEIVHPALRITSSPGSP